MALNGARSMKDTFINKWRWNRTDEDLIPKNMDFTVNEVLEL
jgi:hypothetical protein